MFRTSVSVCTLLAALSGCSSRPSRINPPGINAQEAGRAAVAEYDANSDGTIEGSELDKSPALKSALAEIDKNGDGKLSAEEIAARIEEWQRSKVAIMSFNCKVTLDKAPLAGATVTLVPEKFLGPNVLPATGVTGEQGHTTLTVAKDKLPNPNLTGVHCGLYRVEISKQQNGKEIVPPRYNVSSELGQEVAQSNPAMVKGIVYDLKSR